MPDLVSRQIELTLSRNDEVALARGHAMTVLGRGVNFSTAHEIALKIRELSSLFVEPYSPADLLHGPIAALTERTSAILVAPPGPAHESVIGILPELRRRAVRTTIIATESTEGADRLLPLVPGVPEWLSPLTAVIPGQVAALRIAERLGRNVDNPPGLAKVTLLECTVDGEGSVVVPGRLLLDISRSLPDSEVTIEHKPDEAVVIVASGGANSRSEWADHERTNTLQP